MEKRNSRAGVAAAVGACVLWGVLPIYWKLLEAASAYEIFTHRIVWSFVFMLLVLAVGGRLRFAWQETKQVLTDRRRALYLMGASLFISFNWLTYIWAVNHAHILEASLGYYINPLFSIFLGAVLLKERPAPAQMVAIGLAACAVAIRSTTCNCRMR